MKSEKLKVFQFAVKEGGNPFQVFEGLSDNEYNETRLAEMCPILTDLPSIFLSCSYKIAPI